jgi:predicted RNA-binding protein with PIN domain
MTGPWSPGEPDEVLSVPLPAAARQRVLSFAAQALGTLAAEDVPAQLKAVARFTPSKRARMGATHLAAALDGDPVFRQRVAAWTRAAMPQVTESLDRGEHPPAADPLDLAAVSYLLRQPGWTAAVQLANESVAERERTAVHADAEGAVTRLTEQLAAVRTEGRAALERLRADAAREAAEAAESRRRLRDVEGELRRARVFEEEVAVAAERAAQEARDNLASVAAESRRLRSRLADAEAALEASRRAAREGRSAESVRLRLLLDTVVEAAQGLRRELALPPTTTRPADSVGGVTPDPAGVDDLALRAHAADDPAVLDQLLALPQVHLVVDGYNVTKTGYGSLSLAEQRSRLVTGLAVLAARTGAEVTCVFDGTTLDVRVVQASPRGVRVLFSSEGETADELIRRLVRAEPPGRPVVVVSSDREVADGVLQSGARPLPSTLLLRRLDRA